MDGRRLTHGNDGWRENVKRRVRTGLQRAKIFLEYSGKCHLCGEKIQKNVAWELEHVIAFELTRDDSDDNLRPAHVECHKIKTKDDKAVIAKAKRIQAKHLGAWKSKQKIPSRGFGQWQGNAKNLEGEYIE